LGTGGGGNYGCLSKKLGATSMNSINIALDGNEANTPNRVGSNVFAFELLSAIEEITRNDHDYSFTVLLNQPAQIDMPVQRKGWTYRVIKPSVLWTQIALPIYLYLNKHRYDVLFTPSHYAPRLSAVPYVSSVMDLAFLKFPDQFVASDLVQLKYWTKYSVKHAKKVIAISQATKKDVVELYRKLDEDVEVVYPAITGVSPTTAAAYKQFLKQHQIRNPYFLFVGTFQPRKNIIRLVEAFESLCREMSAQKSKSRKKILPQLVLAGKVGWLADETIDRIKKSPFYEYIVMPGFIADEMKPALYQGAAASILVGLYEGFGLPPLESLSYGCIPIVSNNSSLPEVVGEAGLLVDPTKSKDIATAMKWVLSLTAKQKAQLRKKGRDQAKKFDWARSAQQVLDVLKSVVRS
jgi:glycosyltransferase involved in cell wall biosynthesis